MLARTQLEYMGYAVEWNPFNANRLAVSTAQHFGIVGQGKQVVLDMKGKGMAKVHEEPLKDGCYDCAWSPVSENHLAYVCGDGSMALLDLHSKKHIYRYKEHTAEVYSVDWSHANKRYILTGAWDNLIKVWHPDRGTSLRTFSEHSNCVYTTVWSPHESELFASTSGDCTLKIWDMNDKKSIQTIPAHKYEILTMDWNKYDKNIIATGSVDKMIKIWDRRIIAKGPINTLEGHEFAVRRVKWSPLGADLLASASYDMSLRVWDVKRDQKSPSKFVMFDHHTEFVLGIDFNNYMENVVATCSWDESVTVFDCTKPPPKRSATSK
mmetsp:Transcript_13152/g.32257  ORF Transcript_13152/g.32257 Transcript_13152/m.32257 type:complete len:323 (+) Transcript_13152:116-1084(+)